MSEIVLIGDTTSPEFADLIQQLRQQYPNLPKNTYSDIATWVRSDLSHQQPLPLTIVLQTWSDEYLPADVDRLVGATLFTGLLCCYGAWCEGDGRTHHVWPHSTRIPLRFAYQTITARLERIAPGRPILPPTAARDEVFLYRQRPSDMSTESRQRTALVVSPDRVYRTTFAAIMASCGWKVSSMSTNADALRNVRSPHVIVHDLDPQCNATSDSLTGCQSRFPHAQLYGLANQPQRLSNIAATLPIISKLDPCLAVGQIGQPDYSVLR